ncbi:MAG: phosphoribosylformylglycinamidine synthase subunit PurS [Parvibaculales bacterium]
MKAIIHITLKAGVLDPQGKAIEHALSELGFTGLKNVRQGKRIEIALHESDKKKAEEKISAMCQKLLVNMVIENYEIEIKD